MVLGQSFEAADLGTVGLLILLEASLSVDNALIMGVLAGRLSEEGGKKAIRYGTVGAFVFRAIAVVLASYLIRWNLLKLLGSLYLIYVAMRHLIFGKPGTTTTGLETGRDAFWRTVMAIELTDLAFAVDNILAAVALVGPPPPEWPADQLHPKLWVIFVGGTIGLVLTRFAATACLTLLRRFPRLNVSAYLIVLLVACKLLVEWKFGSPIDFDDVHQPVFWVFWTALAGCLAAGLLTSPKRAGPE
jgi:YkoY family integral membrane protein